MPRLIPLSARIGAALLLAALALSASSARAQLCTGTVECLDGVVAQKCAGASVVGANGAGATSCLSTLPGTVAIVGNPITLESGSGSTTEGRGQWDGTRDQFRIGTGTRSALVGPDGSVNAADYLACDGTTDDRSAFATLVQAGGAAAGKTLFIPSKCTDNDGILLSSPGAGNAVATLAPGTSIVCEVSDKPSFKFARRYCSGGSTPGAACPGGAGECNGGSCVYDTGSAMFADSGASTYTFLKGATTAACTADNTPWPCCRGSGVGTCSVITKGPRVIGCAIGTNQIEPFGRCDNGGAEDGFACANYCAGGAFAGFSCDADADCPSSTCTETSCPSTGTDQCDDAPKTPSGTGTINVLDFSEVRGVVIENVRILDLYKGQAIKVGNAARIEGTETYAQNVSSSGTQFGRVPLGTPGWSALDIEHTFGIEAGSNAIISDVRVFGDTAAIRVGASSTVTNVQGEANSENSAICADTNSAAGVSFANVTCDTLSGTGAIGIRGTNGATITAPRLSMSGSSAIGADIGSGASIIGGQITNTGASGVCVHTTTADVGGSSITGTRCIGGASAASQIGIDADERRTRVSGVSFHNFTGNNSQIAQIDGDYSTFTGNTYLQLGRVGYGFRIGGAGVVIANNTGVADGARECIHVEVGPGAQNVVEGNYFGGCYVAVAPPATSTDAINYTTDGNRIFAPIFAGVISTTGSVVTDNYIAWVGSNCVGTSGDEGLGCSENTADGTTGANTDADSDCGGSGTCRPGVAVLIGDNRRPEDTTYADWDGYGHVSAHSITVGNLLHSLIVGDDFADDNATLVQVADQGNRCNSGADQGKACTTSADCASAATCDRTYLGGSATAPTYASAEITGNVYATQAQVDSAIDLATCVEQGDDSSAADACTISKFNLGGTCDGSTTIPGACMDFPSTSQGNVTSTTIGAWAYDHAGTLMSNWDDSMGTNLMRSTQNSFTLVMVSNGSGCTTGSSAWFGMTSMVDSASCNTTAADKGIVLNDDWIADRIGCGMTGDASSDCDLEFSLTKNGTDTALLCQSTNTALCTDTDSVNFDADDLFAVRVLENGAQACTAAAVVYCTVQGHYQ